MAIVRSTTNPGGGAVRLSPGVWEVPNAPRPAARPATPAAPAAAQAPAQSQYLSDAQANLQGQVARGGITQAQANAEMARLRSLPPPAAASTAAPAAATPAATSAPAATTAPYQPISNPGQSQYLANASADLQRQVATGGINQGQADAELNRLRAMGQAPTVAPGFGLNTPGDVVNATFDVNQNAMQQGNQLSNPNQVNPFGSQTVTYDAQGRPTVTQGLSQANQNVVGGIQGAAQGANQGLQQLLASFGQTLSGNSGPSSYENAVFSQLTRGLGEEKQQALQQAGQTLANRGIPVGSEAYNNEMNRLERQFSDRHDSARSQAVLQGNTQMLQGMGALSGIGQAGFMNPTFQGFNSVGSQAPDVGSLFNTLTGQNVANAQNANQLQMANNQNATQLQVANINKRPSGGGGSSRGTSAPRFNIVSPPGS